MSEETLILNCRGELSFESEVGFESKDSPRGTVHCGIKDKATAWDAGIPWALVQVPAIPL